MSTTKNGDCGCGCGGASMSTAVAVTDVDAHVRPRFFAGQLLTEEDLGRLGDYVVNKNRLHNRSFFGEGVVCGLEVTCDPCGGGHVSVRPGHALDCCGNDIVVPCPQTLDVNAMVHRLRVESLGGIDCGDPCANGDSKKTDEGSEGKDGEKNGTVVLPARRRYSLYVSYAEEETDPVAPYATGEPCGAQGCKTTRTRETYTLSLRCEAEPRKPDDLLSRIVRCIRDFQELTQKDDGTVIWDVFGPARAALAVSRGEARVEFSAADAEALKDGLARAARPLPADPSESDVRALLDGLRTLVMAAATLTALPAEERAAAMESFKIADEVARAPEIAGAASERLAGHLTVLTNPLERSVALALVDGAPAWTDPDIPIDLRTRLAHLIAGQGAALNEEVLRQIAGNLAAVRDRLLMKLDGAMLTDCRLRRDVQAIQITVPADPPEGGGDEEVAEAFARSVLATSSAAQALATALVRHLAGCVCAAILPPCRPCEDTGVLLATIEIEDCEVVQICNLERRLVLTPTLLAYWLPMEHLAQLLDQVCCVLPRKVGELGRRPVGKQFPHGVESPRLFVAPPSGFEGTLNAVGAVLGAAGVAEPLGAEVTRAMAKLPQLEVLRPVVEPVRADAAAAEDRLTELERRLGDITTLKRDLTNLRKRNAALEKQVKDLAGGS